VQDARSPDHYYGSVVDTYEAERRDAPEWAVEQETVQGFTSRVATGASILDVPVGTGRFLPYYKGAACSVTGLDLSGDMLRRSAAVATQLSFPVRFLEGSAFRLPFPDAQFDHVISFRLLTWFDEPEFERALRELSRVTRVSLLVSFNLRSHPSYICDPLALPRYMKMLRSQHQRQRAGIVHPRLQKRAFVSSVLQRNGIHLISEHKLKIGRVFTYSAWELAPTRRGRS